MTNKQVNQNNNRALGDIVGGDKIVQIMKEISQPTQALRSQMNFDIQIDSDNTTLISKLKAGEVNRLMRINASKRKLETLRILIDMCKSESGEKVVSDIYDNLTTMLENKFLMYMDEGDLLKTNMSVIHEQFSELIKKYEKLVVIDESFLTGLLYIATSNCAIKWKLEEDAS